MPTVNTDLHRNRERVLTIEHGTETLYPSFDKATEVMVLMGGMSHTITPYDTYARLYARRVEVMLRRYQIDGAPHICSARSLGARGSGPGGVKRLGDDWLPPEIVVIVRLGEEDAVRKAWQEFKERSGIRKPFLITGNKWWDSIPGGGGKWREGAWQAVIVNAIHIAQYLKLPQKRIKALHAYRIRKAKQLHTNYVRSSATKRLI